MGATTKKTFYPVVKDYGPFALQVRDMDIKNEPMFYNCSPLYAYENGGPITRDFIQRLPGEFLQNSVFDSRVHMLMNGWYPCIPGWHHDDVPRPNNGQPDYDTPAYKSKHILGVVNADISPTEFLNTTVVMPKIPESEIIYKVWNDEIEKLINSNLVTTMKVKDRQLYYFDCDTFHRGTKAQWAGWRWFGRISINTDRVRNITNEKRVNAMVYLENPTIGW
jgi:hypothetical protein